MTRREVLDAYYKVKSNKGAAGVDAQSLDEFERDLKKNLYRIWNRLSSGQLFPATGADSEDSEGIGRGENAGHSNRLGSDCANGREASVGTLGGAPVSSRLVRLSAGKVGVGRSGTSPAPVLDYDWVCDLDIQGFFDTIDHDLMMKAVRKHARETWICLYIERWLNAPAQDVAGHVTPRDRGTPQGGVISPLLANLFLHYAFDCWMVRHWRHLPFERYADDVHCRSKREADLVRRTFAARLRECGLTLHPEKTHVVYCKDSNRWESHPHEKFDLLGFTFRPRKATTRRGGLFCSFSPAISSKAAQRIRDEIRRWQLHRRTEQSLGALAQVMNPKLRGWFQYSDGLCPRRSGPSNGISANRWSAGPVENTKRFAIIVRVRGSGCSAF